MSIHFYNYRKIDNKYSENTYSLEGFIITIFNDPRQEK